MILALTLFLLFACPGDQDCAVFKSFETDDCFISFLEDKKGDKFVVKQIKSSSPDEQFLLVIDAAGCRIAEEMGILMNRVKIIPANGCFSGKTKLDFPATLHTMVPGVCSEEVSQYQNIDIHQKMRKENSALWKKWGPLPPQERGLSRTVIQNMAKHRDLPRLVALDTFLGNADRSGPNLYYDEIADHFYGIDLAASFSSELGKEAVLQLQTIGRILKPEEKAALKEYGTTLKMLVDRYPPGKQEEILLHFAKSAGFVEGSFLLNEDVKDRISHHQQCIRTNYRNCQKLANLILSPEF